jgi:hypothetical protein
LISLLRETGIEAGVPSSADSRVLGEDRTAGDDATRETLLATEAGEEGRAVGPPTDSRVLGEDRTAGDDAIRETLLGIEAGDPSTDSRPLGEDLTAGDDATRDPLDFNGLCIGDERVDVLMRFFLTLSGGAMAMVSLRRLTTEISAVLSWSVDARETLLRRDR